MTTGIERVEPNTALNYLELLLLADPSEQAIRTYLPASTVITYQENNEVLGLLVLYPRGQCPEIKNVAVSPHSQGKGIGTRLIEAAFEAARSAGADCLEIGTGNSSLRQLALYQRCGFRIVRIERDFFADYPEPIIEDGIRCLDLVILRARL